MVQTTDTDIVLLSMYHFNKIIMLEELWIHRNDRYIPVRSVVQNLSVKYDKSPSELCECLLSVYVLTGCDSVSYMYRRGKRMAASVVFQVVGTITEFSKFGDTGVYGVTPAIINDARILMAALYGKPPVSSLNTLREHVCKQQK